MKQQISKESKQILWLLGDLARLELYPKKIVLNSRIEKEFVWTGHKFAIVKKRNNIVECRIIAPKHNSKSGTARTIHRVINEWGFELSLDHVLSYCMPIQRQKRLANKYIHLDLKR